MEYYSFRKVQKELDIKEDDLKRLVSEGKIPAIHISRDVRKIKKSLLNSLYSKVSAWQCLGIPFSAEKLVVSIELLFPGDKRFLLPVEETRTIGNILDWLKQNSPQEIKNKVYIGYKGTALTPEVTLKNLIQKEQITPGTPVSLSVSGLDAVEGELLSKIVRGEGSPSGFEDEDEYCELSEAIERLGIEGPQIIELIQPGEIKFFKETLWFKKNDIDTFKIGDPLQKPSAEEDTDTLSVDEDTSEAQMPIGDTKGKKEANKEDKRFNRNSTIRYYKKMNPWKNHPLAVAFSGEEIKKIMDKAIAEKKGDKELDISSLHPLVKVVPHFPGCLVVPETRTIDVTPALSQAYFEITPLAEGDLGKASVEILYKGKSVEEVNTPCTVSRTGVTKLTFALGIIIPILSSLLEALEIDLKQGMPKLTEFMISWIVRIVHAAGGITQFGFIIGIFLLLVTILIYWIRKARQADPIERLLTFENKPATSV